MHELLPFYERELALLQQQAEAFARRHPHTAGQLSASGELLQDPQVQRLVQSFALLGARIHARLEDDVPEVTRPLLQRLSPQWLRPFPACAIAQFDDGASSASAARVLPAGTLLESARAEANGDGVRFTTTAPVQLLPLRVAWAGYSGALNLPAGTPLPREATALLSLRLELVPPDARWNALGVEHVRLFLDAEPALATLLRETLTGQVAATLVQLEEHGPWRIDPGALPQPVGLQDGDSLLGADPGWPPAQRLLAEYFAFPEKFDFIDVPLPGAARRWAGRTLGLHFALAGPRGDGAQQRQLEQVQARHLRSGCVPVVNLFADTAKADALEKHPGVFGLVPTTSARRDIHAITRVTCTCKADKAEGTLPLEPWGGPRRGEPLPEDCPAEVAALLPPGGLYWSARRNDAAPRKPGAHAMELTLVDVACEPAPVPGATLTVEVRATDGALPARLPWGQAGGDLCVVGGGGRVRLLRTPTPPRLPVLDAATVWRVVSMQSPKALALSGAGLEALKDSLRLLDLPRGAHTEALLQGLAAIECRPAQAWVVDPDGAGLVRGTEVRLAVHEAAFASRGLRLFARVLSRWFAQYARADSFTRLLVVSAASGEVLVECPRLDGDVPLI